MVYCVLMQGNSDSSLVLTPNFLHALRTHQKIGSEHFQWENCMGQVDIRLSVIVGVINY